MHGVSVQETGLLACGGCTGKGDFVHGDGVQETRLLYMGLVCGKGV